MEEHLQSTFCFVEFNTSVTRQVCATIFFCMQVGNMNSTSLKLFDPQMYPALAVLPFVALRSL